MTFISLIFIVKDSFSTNSYLLSNLFICSSSCLDSSSNTIDQSNQTSSSVYLEIQSHILSGCSVKNQDNGATISSYVGLNYYKDNILFCD